jgi:rod shape determining protein RodA
MGAISILNLYGIGGADHTLFRRQVVLVVLSIIMMVIGSLASYRYLKNYTGPVLVAYVCSLMLVALPLAFSAIRNIRAWIVIGGFTFEPSELAKLAFIILMAKYFSQRHVHISQFRHIIVSGIYCAIPSLIILAQPDLGSAAIIMIVWVSDVALGRYQQKAPLRSRCACPSCCICRMDRGVGAVPEGPYSCLRESV